MCVFYFLSHSNMLSKLCYGFVYLPQWTVSVPKICVPNRHNACDIIGVKKIFVIMKKAKESL